MPSLKESLGQGALRPSVVRETLDLIDAEVGGKGGISGFALKSAYGVVKAVKPGFVAAVVETLLDGFLDALEPIWKESQGPQDFRSRLLAAKSRAAEALLGVTDLKARGAKTPVVKSLYEKLRPSAKPHVEEAIPRLSQLLERQLGKIK